VRRALIAAVWVSIAVSSVETGVDAQAAACTVFGAPSAGGSIDSTEIGELSGLAASRLHPGVLWAHNDSGDTARVFALAEDGTALGSYTVRGAEAVDWEDIAVGPGPEPGSSAVFIGDIGDNLAARTDGVTVYRVLEPDARPDGTGGELAGADTLRLVYPDGPADAEALIVDPLSGDLVIVTKDLLGNSRALTALAADLVSGTPIELSDAGPVSIDPSIGGGLVGLPSTMVTAADVTPDGRWVLVRTYQAVLAYERPEGEPLVAAFGSSPCTGPSATESQGEAIAVTSDGSAYLTASEVLGAIERGELSPGSPAEITRVAIDPPAAPVTEPPVTEPPATEPPATEPPATEPPATEPPITEPPALPAEDSSGPSTLALVLPIAGAIIIGLVLILRGRFTSRPSS
jgi:cell division septation protein DedD